MIFSTAWRTVLPILLGGYVAVAQDVGSSEESSRNLRRDKSPPPPPPPPLVDHLFTYGAPSVAGNPAVANPGNKCGKTICNSIVMSKYIGIASRRLNTFGLNFVVHQ